MTRFSEQELEEMASPYLTQEITEVFATTDGQVFYDANRAGQHATQRSLTMYAFGEAATGEEASGNELSSNQPTAETANEQTSPLGIEGMESPQPEARQPEANSPQPAVLKPEATTKSKK